MKEEHIDFDRLRRMEERLECQFREDGTYAEMSMEVTDYRQKTQPIPGVRYGFYHGDLEPLHQAVGAVDGEWVQYFGKDSCVYGGFAGDKLVAFCIVDVEAESIVSDAGCRVGSIGCVGTAPEYRGRQIALRMVDLATVYLKEQGCQKVSISYTAIDHWYRKLGYETFARFSILKEENQ